MLFEVVGWVGRSNDVLYECEVFTGWLLFLSPSWWCLGTEGNSHHWLQSLKRPYHFLLPLDFGRKELSRAYPVDSECALLSLCCAFVSVSWCSIKTWTFLWVCSWWPMSCLSGIRVIHCHPGMSYNNIIIIIIIQHLYSAMTYLEDTEVLSHVSCHREL